MTSCVFCAIAAGEKDQPIAGLVAFYNEKVDLFVPPPLPGYAAPPPGHRRADQRRHN